MNNEHWKALLTIPVKLNDKGELESSGGEMPCSWLRVSKGSAEISATLSFSQLAAIVAWMEEEDEQRAV